MRVAGIDVFQSTLPARGATRPPPQGTVTGAISIHAPRTGSDQSPVRRRGRAHHFNPRSPHGERPMPLLMAAPMLLFQSTLPARGATWYWYRCTNKGCNFNPRSPHGERRALENDSGALLLFQSTLPARGATVQRSLCCNVQPFQSTLPARGATRTLVPSNTISPFQSTLPARGATQSKMRTAPGADEISIHAPRTGSDIRSLSSPYSSSSFQSTLPARGATRKESS